MNRVDGMEALDAVENGMIKLGQNRDIWQNDVVYAALAGVRLLLNTVGGDPQSTKFQEAPCHSPPKNMVIIRFRYWRNLPFRFPPKEMYR